MIVLAAAILGGVFGALQARKRGGNRMDMAQYAAGYAIALAMVGLFVTIFVGRMA